MAELSVSEHDNGMLVVDSRLVAERLGIEHDNFLQTVQNYQSQIEKAFGILLFETGKNKGRGRPQKYALLSEDQATFVMTLSRNTPEVVQCKLELVQAFSKAKELLRQREPKPSYVPYWYDRMKIALSDTERPLQRGYFCIYQEIMGFFAELETRLGYLVADVNPKTGSHLVPDISIGRRFNEFLRDENEIPSHARLHFLRSSEPVDFRAARPTKKGWQSAGKHYSEIRIYNHVYPKVSHGNYQVQQANSYPDKYLMIFKYFLQEYWVPDFCIPYLLERDLHGLIGVKSRIFGMSILERQALAETQIGKLLPHLMALPESA